jgi:hypothetical protein
MRATGTALWTNAIRGDPELDRAGARPAGRRAAAGDSRIAGCRRLREQLDKEDPD